jgi:hypothetical protein
LAAEIMNEFGFGTTLVEGAFTMMGQLRDANATHRA